MDYQVNRFVRLKRALKRRFRWRLSGLTVLLVLSPPALGQGGTGRETTPPPIKKKPGPKILPSRKTSPTTGSKTQTDKSNSAPVVKSPSGIELVWIAPGTFMMGADNGEADEKPVHAVFLNSNEEDRFNARLYDKEVQTTGEEWRRAVNLLNAGMISRPEYDQAEARYNQAKAKRASIWAVNGFYLGRYEVTQAQWLAVMGSNPSKFPFCGANCPVDNVSWDDAQKFISKLNERNDGFTDMHGNVEEWCEDWYHETYEGAPANGAPWIYGGGTQRFRVLRGGCFFYDVNTLRSAKRYYYNQDQAMSYFGFRVVAEVRGQ
jgi:formylglycine-generating enzyme required for sulfatase activity